ncbi:MAG: hypothetical protein NC336_04890 [Clostridium sp.]|nr:hypothetical protein [Clostridium sp.]
MNVTLDKKEDGCALMTVSITEADYKEKVDKNLRKFGRDHTIPGFRKGHVPFGELKRRFGRQMTSDVINEEVYNAVINYIRDNDLKILGEPVPVEVKELDTATQTDFTFEYELAMTPEIDVKIDKDLHLPFYEIEVTDEMIADQDTQLRKRFGAQVPGETVEPDALVKGVMMELDENGAIKEGEGSVQVLDAIVGPMFFKSKEETDKFVGKKVDDKVVFNPSAAAGDDTAELASMLHIDKEAAAGMKSDFEFTISEIIVVRPAELGEEYYTNVFGKDKVNNEEEYRQGIRDMIASQLIGNSRALFAAQTRETLLEKFGGFQLPERVLKLWLMRRNDELNEENIDESFKSMEKHLRWELLSTRIAENLGVKITEEKLKDFAKMIAARQFAQYGMTNIPDETVAKYAETILADEKYRPQLYDQLFENELFGAIDNAVTLDKETVSLDRFKEIAQAE